MENMQDKTGTKKRALKLIWILFALASILIWVPKTDQLLSRDYEQIAKHIAMDDHWEIAINEQEYHDVSLKDFHIKAIHIKDKITMQRKLPDDWEFTEGVLRLLTRQTVVWIYIDGELIYEYGYDRLMKNKTLGSGYQFINFPSDYKGKTLRIELQVGEENIFTRLDSVRIYEWSNVYRALMTENRLPLLLGGFLVIFGLVGTMITMFALVFSIKYIRMLCLSLFSLCMGLWTLCYYNVVLIFSIPLYAVAMLEYFSLYLCPIPLIVYMYENVKRLNYKLLTIIYFLLFFVQVAFDIVIFTLHAFDIVHCATVLSYMHILLICLLIYFMVIMILNLKSSKLTGRMYLLGMLVVVTCIGYDLVNYRMERNLGSSLSSAKGVSAIGMMVFIFILIFVFYIDLTQKLMQETERASLLKSAYTDELTQLHNRRYCSEYMKEISEVKTGDYAIVCFDLNNLKTTNDTYGHAQGDILIRSAADVIERTFKEYGVVGRMGGDEFIAILKTAHKEVLETLMQQFQTNIAQKNKEIEGLCMSIAYGYASSEKTGENDIERLYQIADDRMYENKKAYKLNNGISGR